VGQNNAEFYGCSALSPDIPVTERASLFLLQGLIHSTAFTWGGVG